MERDWYYVSVHGPCVSVLYVIFVVPVTRLQGVLCQFLVLFQVTGVLVPGFLPPKPKHSEALGKFWQQNKFLLYWVNAKSRRSVKPRLFWSP